jgi:hypothetical protein
MKKTKIAWALLPLAAMVGLVGCQSTSTSVANGSSNTTSSQTNSSANSSSKEESSSKSSSGASSNSSEDQVEHRDDFVKSVSDSAVIRTYDGRFDKMLDDFSGETMNGTGDAEANAPTLRVMVDSNLDSFPCSDDAAIYKLALGTPALETEAGIGFRIRVREGKISLKNLALDLRGDDSLSTYPVKLAEATDVDGEALPELNGEFQDVTIGLDSLADEYYPNKDGTTSNMKISDKIVGFHLHATTDEVSAVIEISEVYAITKANARVTIDSFDRTDINNVGPIGAWWGGSASGFIIQKGVKIANGKKYVTPAIDESYKNLVLNVEGNASATVLTALDKNGNAVGSPVAYSAAKDKDGNALATPVNGTFAPLAISLEKSGLLGSGVSNIQIASTSEIVVSEVFETNFEEPVLSKDYPHIDAANAKNIDVFERTQSSIDTDWDTSAARSEISEAGLNGFVSYSHSDTIKVDGHNLVLPATESGNDSDYDEVTIGSKQAYKNANYVVFAIETEGSLTNFRFSFGSESAIYLSSAVAKEGLPTIPTALDYPYANVDGYEWYIVDLNMAGTADSSGTLNVYFTGDSEVKIGSIFFAEESDPVYEIKENDIASITDTSVNGYSYVGGLDNFDSQFFGIEVKGDGTATFDSFRVEYNGTTKWIGDGEVVGRLSDGAPLTKNLIIPTSTTTLYIDIPASGYDLSAGTAHLHIGDAAYTGTVTITKLIEGVKAYSEKWSDGAEVTTTKGTYSYILGMDSTFVAEKFYVHVSGDGTENLKLFRVEVKDSAGTSAIVWANESDKNLISRADGKTFDCEDIIDATGVDLVINLKEAGIETEARGQAHFHIDGTNGGTLTFGAVTAVAEDTPYSIIVNAYSETI